MLTVEEHMLERFGTTYGRAEAVAAVALSAGEPQLLLQEGFIGACAPIQIAPGPSPRPGDGRM